MPTGIPVASISRSTAGHNLSPGHKSDRWKTWGFNLLPPVRNSVRRNCVLCFPCRWSLHFSLSGRLFSDLACSSKDIFLVNLEMGREAQARKESMRREWFLGRGAETQPWEEGTKEWKKKGLGWRTPPKGRDSMNNCGNNSDESNWKAG